MTHPVSHNSGLCHTTLFSQIATVIYTQNNHVYNVGNACLLFVKAVTSPQCRVGQGGYFTPVLCWSGRLLHPSAQHEEVIVSPEGDAGPAAACRPPLCPHGSAALHHHLPSRRRQRRPQTPQARRTTLRPGRWANALIGRLYGQVGGQTL